MQCPIPRLTSLEMFRQGGNEQEMITRIHCHNTKEHDSGCISSGRLREPPYNKRNNESRDTGSIERRCRASVVSKQSPFCDCRRTVNHRLRYLDGPYGVFAHIPLPDVVVLLMSSVAGNALYRPCGFTTFGTSEDEEDASSRGRVRLVDARGVT